MRKTKTKQNKTPSEREQERQCEKDSPIGIMYLVVKYSSSFLIGETFNGRTKCEHFCGAKGYELVNLSYGDFAESKESCTALLNTHLHCACYYSLRTELCQYIIHSFCTQFTFHTDRFQLKREISRTMTFRLYYAITFVERYEKTIKILLSLLLVFDGRCKSNHQRNSICLYGQRIFKC